VSHYQERVKNEVFELDRKIRDLNSFISNHTTFHVLEDADQKLLTEQYLAMLSYSSILHQRIARF
jgi:hypothetical protein